MNILVFNCGSSSLTYKVFRAENVDNVEEILSGKAHRVGIKGVEPSFIENQYENKIDKKIVPIENHKKASSFILEYIKDKNIPIDYVGHRFVHGGSKFTDTTFIDEDVLEKLVDCIPLAPIHNPISLSVIRQVSIFLKNVPQYVAFDSAFHFDMPEYSYTYALPKRIVEEFGFRKYGFHGLSYSYVCKKASRFLQRDAEELKIVACHLGTGGASVAAIQGNRPIDTSMGYSPLPGLVMSTRCGDIDPMLTLYVMIMYGYRPDRLMDLLNNESGLLGVSGVSSDIRDILHEVSEEENQSKLAFKMYVHRLKRYIGSYIALLKGINVLIFTDDIGVHNCQVREKICEKMDWAGIILDNNSNKEVMDDRVYKINSDDSNVDILTIPTKEELVICLEGLKIIGGER